MKRYEAAKSKMEALQRQKEARLAKADVIGAFMFILSEREEGITEFEDGLWLATVTKVTACHDGKLVFTFQNGTEIEG